MISRKRCRTRWVPASSGRASFSELNFSTFILSLSTSAMVCLGELRTRSATKRIQTSPWRSRRSDHRDLKEKTRGNLNPDEDRLIDGILYDLHIRYVKAAC
jgi:hypothetical protein